MASGGRFTDYGTVQDYLFSLKAVGVRYGIDRMRAFSAQLGHPEQAVPCIHIAGTNGKGSTAAMVEAILRAAGCRTGLYTSPHLVRLGERVQVNRMLLTESEIVDFVNELSPIADRIGAQCPDDRPSFFEFMTAMAFLQFQRRACDWNVIEVGMGGRLDATNIVEPAVSVITSIGLDHCEFLGDTLAKIAFEKAGIIKSGRPVVMGCLPAEAEEVVRLVARERGSELWSVREHFGDEPSRYPRTGLAGSYQQRNAATAVLVRRVLGERIKISDTEMARALAGVAWAGRWQRLELDGWTLILDASHNPEGAEVLEENLALLAQEGREVHSITGVLGEARARPLLSVLSRHCRALTLVVPQQARACSTATLRSLVPAGNACEVTESSVEVLFPGPGQCALARPGRIVLVTGSIYLLGEVLARWEPQRGDLEARLQDF